VGRIAVDLTERIDSPGIVGGQVAEIMRFVIDKVEMTTDENGALVNARLQDGAQMHVYGRNAAGVEVREAFPAPSNTVRLQPLSEIPDRNGDTTSVILFMDLEAGFSRAGTRLAALENIAGQFSMRMTISHVSKLVRKATGTDLVGDTLTVNTQPPVSGAGFRGNAWIRMYSLN